MDASEWTTCWIPGDGTIQCNGALLRGTSSREDGAFVKVSVGGNLACGLREDGTVRCFLGWVDCERMGCSVGAQSLTGPGGDLRRDLPGKYLDIDVDATGWAVLAIDGRGHVLRWNLDATTTRFGSFEDALYGGGFRPSEPSDGGASDPEASRTDFVRIAGTPFQACGLAPSGKVSCWQVSDRMHRYEPPGTFVALSAGSSHLCALATPKDGSVVCWGGNEGGQAADVHGRFSAVSAGDNHTCALQESGEAECWGDGSTLPTSVPEGRFSAVAAGGGHRCGLRETGEVECWGFGAGLPAVGSGTDVHRPLGAALERGCTSYASDPTGRFACELERGYLSSIGFAKVNASEFAQAFPTTTDGTLGKRRNIWIAGPDADLPDGGALGVRAVYGAIDPDSPSERLVAPIPAGTRILHENPGGDRYELMTKLPAGTAPENGDWAFSRHLLDGTRLSLQSASAYGGAKPPTCLDCHEMADRRARTDLLWGIPRAAMP
jgi:hypothetical protein